MLRDRVSRAARRGSHLVSAGHVPAELEQVLLQLHRALLTDVTFPNKLFHHRNNPQQAACREKYQHAKSESNTRTESSANCLVKRKLPVDPTLDRTSQQEGNPLEARGSMVDIAHSQLTWPTRIFLEWPQKLGDFVGATVIVLNSLVVIEKPTIVLQSETTDGLTDRFRMNR